MVLYLKKRELIRSIYTDMRTRGYVWNHSDISDAVWKERARNPPMTRGLRSIRVRPPEAVVVVIGPRQTDET